LRLANDRIIGFHTSRILLAVPPCAGIGGDADDDVGDKYNDKHTSGKHGNDDIKNTHRHDYTGSSDKAPWS
jgi:hypothetical protein